MDQYNDMCCVDDHQFLEQTYSVPLDLSLLKKRSYRENELWKEMVTG